MSLPEIVSRVEWRAAREELLVKEKAVTRARDALNAERRALPMVEIGEEYVFEGGDGKATLADLFEERHQLVVHHFMFAPEWDAGCRSCSAFLDQVGHLAHLKARDTSFAVVSRAPFTRILPFKARMGWTVPWYSSYGSQPRLRGDPGAGGRAGRAARGQLLPARGRPGVPHLLDLRARARRTRVDHRFPGPHGPRAAGGVGGTGGACVVLRGACGQ
jgi:hypothetical protein